MADNIRDYDKEFEKKAVDGATKPLESEEACKQMFDEVTDELLRDKSRLAESAARTFDQIDSNKNLSLSPDELLRNSNNPLASLEERAAAKILYNNFDDAKKLAVKNIRDEVKGFIEFESAAAFNNLFGMDSNSTAITRRDIRALHTLAGGRIPLETDLRIGDVDESTADAAFSARRRRINSWK